MKYYGIKTPGNDSAQPYIWWVAGSEHESWVSFFTYPGKCREQNANRAPLSEAIKAYESIGYRCVELSLKVIDALFDEPPIAPKVEGGLIEKLLSMADDFDIYGDRQARGLRTAAGLFKEHLPSIRAAICQEIVDKLTAAVEYEYDFERRHLIKDRREFLKEAIQIVNSVSSIPTP